MPPDASGRLVVRASLRACCFALLVCANAALLAFPIKTEAAVTRIGSVTTLQNDSELLQSQSIYVPPDAEIMVVVLSGYEDAPNRLSDTVITIAGNNMTVGFDADASNGHQMGMMYYADVSALGGTQTFAWDLSGSDTMLVGVSVTYAFYKGINLASPIRASGGQQSCASFTSGTLAAQSGDRIVAAISFTSNVSSVSWTGGATEAHRPAEFNGNEHSFAEGTPSGDATVTATINDGDCDGALMVIVLTQSTRVALLKPPNNLGLVGYWSFNEGTSTVATDFSGNGNHGAFTDSPVWTNGKRGKALDFDGSNDRVNIPEGNLDIKGSYERHFLAKGRATTADG
jgi:hypothetical protein